MPQKDLLKETLDWCETIKGHSPQTLRMTKKSLNFESDNLYSSWQHGMELLAHVWGSEESNEGMNAFLEGRKPDFQKFRMRNKRELAEYLDGCAQGPERAALDAQGKGVVCDDDTIERSDSPACASSTSRASSPARSAP